MLIEFLSFLENLPAPFFYLDADGRRGVANARWRALFGEGSPWPSPLDDISLANWQTQFGRGEAFVIQVRLKAAEGWKRGLLSVEPLGVGLWRLDGDGWLVNVTDIEAVVENIEAECEQERVALRMTARQWSSFFHASATGKAMIGIEGEFLVINAELCRLLGYDEEELLQMVPHQLRHPEDAERVNGYFRSLLTGGPALSGVETRYFHRDGHVVHGLLSISLVQDSRRQPLYFAVEMQDDSARRIAEAALEQKVRELAGSNADLARSNAELERFAFIASHDLQEPLRKIRIFAGRLQSESESEGLTEAGLDYLTRLNSAAQRMQQLISDLLEFSRLRRPPHREIVDLTRLATEVAADFDTLIDETGATLSIGPLPTLQGDAVRLRQLIANLLGNAFKFRGAAPPVIEVWARPTPGTPDLAAEHPDLVSGAGFEPFEDGESREREEPGKSVESWDILVRDNGIGFNESDLPRLLEVFGRIHPRDVYPGTGIGLAICRKVAQEHGGEISARSKPGLGATFIVTLREIPLATSPPDGSTTQTGSLETAGEG